MKRFLSFLLLSCVVSFAYAIEKNDTTMMLLDANDVELIADTVIEKRDYEVDSLGRVCYRYSLKVKNVTDADIYMNLYPSVGYCMSGLVEITTDMKDSVTYETAGLIEMKKHLLRAGATTNVVIKWYPTKYSFIRMHFEVRRYRYDKSFKSFYLLGAGHKIHINFYYDDPAGIENQENKISIADANAPAYNLAGQRIAPENYKGVIIQNGKKRILH